jgi:hypothetical protein
MILSVREKSLWTSLRQSLAVSYAGSYESLSEYEQAGFGYYWFTVQNELEGFREQTDLRS